jgi:putative SOS response-associated peptidase YedK
MCGRFAQIEPISNVVKAFFIDDIMTEILPSYNIAPGSKILSVVMQDNKRLLIDFQWGLVPHWAKDPDIGQSMINARAETVGQKPSFRSAFKSRRCLIVASGFYEWKKDGRIKIPFYVKLSSGASFAFAGLYETWNSAGGIELRTCTIITTEANDIMRPIHNRMPVILPRDREDRWLDISIQPDEAMAMLTPFPSDEMEAYPVSTMVNSPKNNSAECITPAR